MNKDTAREVLECIRLYCETRSQLDKIIKERGSGDILVDGCEWRIREIVKQFADLISFNT